MRYPDYLVHFNPNHDPKTGQFAEGNGSNKSTVVKIKKMKLLEDSLSDYHDYKNNTGKNYNRLKSAAETGLKALAKCGDQDIIYALQHPEEDAGWDFWFLFENETLGAPQIADLANRGKTADEIKQIISECSSLEDDNIYDISTGAWALSEWNTQKGWHSVNENKFINACVEVASETKHSDIINTGNYLIHFNRNHGKKNGQFVSGDGDGDGVTNDRYNYKDNRSGQTKGSVVITTPSGRKTLTNTGPTARVGRVGSITKAGSGGGSSKTERHSSSYTETGRGKNYYNGIQLAKRDAKDTDWNEYIGNSNKKYIDGMKLTKSEGDVFTSNRNKKYVKNKSISIIKSKDTSVDGNKEQRMNQKDKLWNAKTTVARNVQNGTVTRGTNVDAKNYHTEATYDKTKGMYKYGDEGIGGMKDYTEDRIANKTVTRGESIENKEHKEVDMAKEDKMYSKSALWAGMNRVDRLMDSKSSLADSNSTSKGVNFVSSEILKLKV